MSQIIIVSTKQNIFKFINEFDSFDQSYYNITVTVEEKLYTDNKTYYDISYSYEFNGESSSRKYIHPFYSRKEDVESAPGVIIFKNKMTEIMVEYLLNDSKALEQLSGTTTAQCYRTNIMLTLSRLWD